MAQTPPRCRRESEASWGSHRAGTRGRVPACVRCRGQADSMGNASSRERPEGHQAEGPPPGAGPKARSRLSGGLRAASQNQGHVVSPETLLEVKLAGTLSTETEVTAEVSDQTQTASLSVLVSADRELPSSFSGPALHPCASATGPCCHTILPHLHPLAALDLTWPRMQGPLDSPQPAGSFSSF